MDKEKPNTQGGAWQYQAPPQGPRAGAVQSNAGHYTGSAHGGDSQAGGFPPSPPEAKVMPAGAAQTSRGGAGRPETGGAGGGGDTGSGGAGRADDSSGAGAGAGKTPGTPGGNGTSDEPIWGS